MSLPSRIFLILVKIFGFDIVLYATYFLFYFTWYQHFHCHRNGGICLRVLTFHKSRNSLYYVSYLDLHLEDDSDGRLKTKIYDKRNSFNFPIVNLPFICSNIPTVPAYGVNISQLIRYSKACSYHDFLERGLLLTKTLLNTMVPSG